MILYPSRNPVLFDRQLRPSAAAPDRRHRKPALSQTAVISVLGLIGLFPARVGQLRSIAAQCRFREADSRCAWSVDQDESDLSGVSAGQER